MRRRSARQPWDGATGDRARVLLECEPEHSPSIIASVIERYGYDVRTCEGPDAGRCDLLANGSCGLVEGADVVVNMLHPRRQGAELLARETALDESPAVVAEMTRSQRQAVADAGGGVDLERVTVVETPVTGKALIDAIQDAAGRRRHAGPAVRV